MLSLKGLEWLFIGVTEIQEKRWLETGEVALHLHAVFPGRHYGCAWEYTPLDYKLVWNRVLQKVLNKSENDAEWSATTNVQSVKRSAANYLGKYLSKGSTLVKAVIDAGHLSNVPCSWYICSKELRTLLLRSVKRFTEELADKVYRALIENSSEFIRWSKGVEVPVGEGYKARVAWIAELTKKGLNFINDFTPLTPVA